MKMLMCYENGKNRQKWQTMKSTEDLPSDAWVRMSS